MPPVSDFAKLKNVISEQGKSFGADVDVRDQLVLPVNSLRLILLMAAGGVFPTGI